MLLVFACGHAIGQPAVSPGPEPQPTPAPSPAQGTPTPPTGQANATPSPSPVNPSPRALPTPEPEPTPYVYLSTSAFRNTSTSVLEASAASAMKAGTFDAAVPFLIELIARLQDTKAMDQLEKLAKIYIALGQAASSIERYPDALAAYRAFLDRFPSDRYVNQAKRAVADLLAASGSFGEAADSYQDLLISDTKLTPDQRREIVERRVDCLVAADRWADLSNDLTALLKESNTPSDRSRFQTLLLIAYAQLGANSSAAEMVRDFAMQSEQGMLDPQTILRLVIAGDILRGKNASALAMTYFQIAVGSGDLKGAITKRIETLLGQRKQLVNARAKPEEIIALNFELGRQRSALEALGRQGEIELEIRGRLANAFETMERPFEHLALLQSIAEDFPDSTYAEQAAYRAFFLAQELMLDQLALRLANEYLENFPTSRGIPDVVVGKANLLIRQREHGLASTFIEDVLSKGDLGERERDMLLMLGVAQFNSAQLDAAEGTFKRVLSAYGDEQAMSSATYWLALVRLFRNDYEGAYDDFQKYVATYSHLDNQNVQDAAFRAGVCLYATEQYEKAHQHFTSWLAQYPQGARRAGVYAFLGDLEAQRGNGQQALLNYRRVERTPGASDDDISYANQRMAAVHETFFKDWKSIKELYQTYLENYGTRGSYAEAIYRIGQAQSQLGETDAMLEGYLAAISKYGDDPSAVQMDDILDLYLSESIRLKGRFPRESFDKLSAEADAETRPVLHLRLARAVDLIKDSTPDVPKKPDLQALVPSSALRHASPAVALWMGERLLQSDPTLARKCFEKVEKEQEFGKLSAEATFQLALLDLQNGQTADAIKRFERFRGELITSARAPEAILKLASLLHAENQDEAALEACRQILENKQWRGPLWPEALYLSGEIQFENRKYAEAHAFFQRIYLLYAGYPEWMAKAYVRAAVCAERLGRFEDAETTLREMESVQGLQQFSAYQEGIEHLKRLSQ